MMEVKWRDKHQTGDSRFAFCAMENKAHQVIEKVLKKEVSYA